VQVGRCSAAPIRQEVTAAVIYVGIDLGKRQHAVCFLNEAGQPVAKPMRVPHTGRGLRQLHAQLAGLGGPHQVIMEASGAHWMGIARKLRAAGVTVHIVNPIQTAGLRKVGIRKTKSDTKDALVVADLARMGRARPSYVPDDQLLELRELERFRWHLADQLGDAKRHVLGVLDKVFPEFADQLGDPFGATGRALLNRCASAIEFAALELGDLEGWIRQASRRQLGRERAEALHAAAQDSLGLDCLGTAARVELQALLAQIKLLEQQIATLDAELAGRMQALPGYLFSVPGMAGLLAVTVSAELGEVQRFDNVKQVVAFAGLDASVFESGDFHATRQHISKRGSPHLRRALYLAALSAIRSDAELAAYFQRKQAEGKAFRVALIAVARKLLARIYVVLRDQRPYAPPPAAHRVSTPAVDLPVPSDLETSLTSP
jgi:transposase